MKRFHPRTISDWAKRLSVLSLLAMGATSLSLPFTLPATAQMASPATPVASGTSMHIGMKELGNPQGYRLKTVRTQRDYPFTRPKGWKVLPSSSIHVSFQHGSNLLPERSSLNVLINNRMLKSIPLTKANILPNALNIPVPPDLLQDNNTLSFQVDQHYTYKCEDPFSEELWTQLLPDNSLTLNYQWQPVHPDLAQYPFPLLDPLNTYTPAVVGYVVPNTASDQSLEAFGVVATQLGQQAQWRALKPYVTTPGVLKNSDNLVLIGTPTENPAIGNAASGMSVRLSGGQFSDSNGTPLPPDYGVLQLIPNPSNPTRTMLIVSGNGPEGVRKAAHVLAQGALNKILTGRAAIVKEYQTGEAYPYRAWDGYVLQSGDNFSGLNLDTMTSRGITGLPIYYPIKRMPDLYLPGHQKVRLHTIYSYASQLDGSQSKLEVLLNGKAIKSVPLNDPNGASLSEFVVDLPTEEFHTYNDLQYQFHMYPDKYDMCRFVTDVHIWGTIHNTSWIEFPGEIKTALPDVGLVNDGGYPFTGFQDLSHVSVVLPDGVGHADLDAMLQMLTRLGRESYSHKGIELTAFHAATLPNDIRGNSHLIVIGKQGQNKLFAELQSKASLLTENHWNTLQDDQKTKLAQINYAPGQGVAEEMLSPWNENKVVFMLTGENDTALAHDAQMFSNDAWFKAIKQGNLTVINDNGPQSLILMKKGEARFFFAKDAGTGPQLPTWAWIGIAAFALLGVASVVRFFFGR